MQQHPERNKIIAYNLLKHFLTFGVPIVGLVFYMFKAPMINSEEEIIKVFPRSLQSSKIRKNEKKIKKNKNSLLFSKETWSRGSSRCIQSGYSQQEH